MATEASSEAPTVLREVGRPTFSPPLPNSTEENESDGVWRLVADDYRDEVARQHRRQVTARPPFLLLVLLVGVVISVPDNNCTAPIWDQVKQGPLGDTDP